ncbi:MAG: hypothetical protein COA78_15535 [Blastopirellula sp.]|nr:MAG: hypothetical protein COA78_15535 [Blastopirellula sp.]
MLDSVIDDANSLGDDLPSGLIRKPGKIKAAAKRKKKLSEVKTVNVLPANIDVQHCDFRNLQVEDGSVDLILTDVIWSLSARKDWLALSECAKKWLKPKGLFVSLIGSETLPDFLDEIRTHLHYQTMGAMVYKAPKMSVDGRLFKQLTPFVIASNCKEKLDLGGLIDALFPKDANKDYFDMQQPISPMVDLTRALSKAGDVVVDPHLGSGTNGVADMRVGQRNFIGCDINLKTVDIARHRIHTEGREEFDPFFKSRVVTVAG